MKQIASAYNPACSRTDLIIPTTRHIRDMVGDCDLFGCAFEHIEFAMSHLLTTIRTEPFLYFRMESGLYWKYFRIVSPDPGVLTRASLDR